MFRPRVKTSFAGGSDDDGGGSGDGGSVAERATAASVMRSRVEDVEHELQSSYW